MRILNHDNGYKTFSKCDPIKSGKMNIFEEKGKSVWNRKFRSMRMIAWYKKYFLLEIYNFKWLNLINMLLFHVSNNNPILNNHGLESIHKKYVLPERVKNYL